MDLEIIEPSEVSQTNIQYHLHVESNKNDTNKLTKQKDSQMSKSTSWLPKGEGGEW